MNKFHLIDDESQLRQQSLQIFTKSELKKLNKNYALISIIGSQSSGKSTLLNYLFQTKFQVLNKTERIGQTTRGIWFSNYESYPIFIFDVQGSDSNQRMEERIKIQRRNSLFALALSNVLLVNIWVHQLGLFKGSQLEILEIILELNLKLFGTEKPKEIIFVVRNYDQNGQDKEQLRSDLYNKVVESWNKIGKPKGKQNIKLEDLFNLQVFFLPDLVYQKEEFITEVNNLREFLIKISLTQQKFQNNILSADFPEYIKNIWGKIQTEKDIDLPAQKIMISNIRCNQIKNQVYNSIQVQFTQILDKASTKLNLEYRSQVTNILQKVVEMYDQRTQNYEKKEVLTSRTQLIEKIQRLIQQGFKSQLSLLSNKIIKQVFQKFSQLNLSQKQQSLIKFKQISIDGQTNFNENLPKIAYRHQSLDLAKKQFSKNLKDTIEAGKDKILIQYTKQLELIIKKKLQAMFIKTLNSKSQFVDRTFWTTIAGEYYGLVKSGQNSLNNFFKQLQIKKNSSKNGDYFQRCKKFCFEQLKSVANSKIKDIITYLARHFKNQFTLDNNNIPRDWPSMKEQQINQLYKKTLQTYQKSIAQFQYFEVQQNDNSRTSLFISSGAQKFEQQRARQQQLNKNSTLIDFIKFQALKKKFLEICQNQYNQSIKKHNQQYNGKTPKWIIVLLVVFMIDDVLLWLKSPYMMIPVTIIGLLLALLFAIGGKSTAMSVLNTLKATIMNKGTNLATAALLNKGGSKKNE